MEREELINSCSEKQTPTWQQPKPAAPGFRAESTDRRLAEQTNPFVSANWKQGLTLYECCKIGLMAVTVMHLRMLSTVGIVASMSLCASVATRGLTDEQLTNQPLPQSRRRFFDPLIRVHLRVLLFTLGFYHISVKGKAADRKQAPIVICNHVCPAEPLYLMYHFLGGPVAEVSNLNYPLLGPILKYSSDHC